MVPYTTITIIYNPHSTRPSKRLATEFKSRLSAAMPKQEITLIPTSHAHHAEELAYALAKASKKPLIISSSGDGGYHEVINGLMKAQAEGAKPTASLLPAGNANDHYRAVHTQDIIELILEAKSQKIDLLKITSVSDGVAFERYAHSYAGIGMTPMVGAELNKHQLNLLWEMWLVLKVIIACKPVTILINGEPETYISLVFTNINRIAKFFTIKDKNVSEVGRFKIIHFYSKSKLIVFISLLRAFQSGFVVREKHETLSFQTIKPTLIQLDGEVGTIDAESDVKIVLVPSVLNCIV
jgi:diacylglycerol kinase (ATP)